MLLTLIFRTIKKEENIMKTKLQHVVLTSLMSLILCGCAANNQNSGEDIPADPSYKSENNWEDMITNLNLFTKDISFEMEILDEDGDRYVIDKENNQFVAQFFSEDEEHTPQYFSYDKNSLRDGNVYTWTTYGERGEVVDYPLDEWLAEFTYPFGFSKDQLQYDSSSKSYKASSASYALRSGEYTFDYRDVELKFENELLTYVCLYSRNESHSIDEEPVITWMKHEVFFKNYGTTKVNNPYI